jgi:hypothetical protein
MYDIAIDSTLDAAEALLQRLGLTVVLTTSAQVIGALALPESEAAAAAKKQHIIAAVLQWQQRHGSTGAIAAAIAIHAGDVLIAERKHGGELIGGELMDLTQWPRRRDAGVVASAAALAGVRAHFSATPLAADESVFQLMHSS